MKKALIITTVSGFVPQFEMNNVKILQLLGYEVHYAADYSNPVYGKDNRRLDNTGIIRHQVDFVRSPFRIMKNFKVYRQLKSLLNAYDFSLIHCHTPMGGVLGRLAAATKKVSVIYTAHGFHFFKGASILNWLLYYPIERLLAHVTDVIITINKEDYINAQKFKLRDNGVVEYIKGVGINTDVDNSKQMDQNVKYKEIGVSDKAFLLTSVGELTKRKNHKVIIQAIARLNNKNIAYLICGTGILEDKLKKLVKKLKLEDQVIFAGYRTDIAEILTITDCFVLPSLQEGLSVALLEAMSLGLPVICSNIRGNIDLIDKRGGILVNAKDIGKFEEAINSIYEDRSKLEKYGMYNAQKVKEYDIKCVGEHMKEIYKRSSI